MKKIGLDTFMDFRKDDRGVRGQGHENSMLAADYLSLRRSDGRRFSIGDFMHTGTVLRVEHRKPSPCVRLLIVYQTNTRSSGLRYMPSPGFIS